jgi:hypothetical protein
MPIAFTSRISYFEVQQTLSRSRLDVWTAIRDYKFQTLTGQAGPTIEDLSKILPMKECSICGRINELRDLGAIEDGPLWVNRTGKPAKTYRAIVYQASPPTSLVDRKTGQVLMFN